MIRELLDTLESYTDSLKKEKRPIFLYGMGNGAEKIHVYLAEHGIDIQGVVASDGFVRGQTFRGFTVESIGDASDRYGELCLILCFGLEEEKSHFLRELSKKHRIIAPNLPVFGDGACDKEYIQENIERFERVYSLLEDTASKEIFKNILAFDITGDISYLDYGNDAPLPSEFFSHGKRHIDIGAYDGDSAIFYACRSDSYSDIVAFEPDPKTFEKLVENTKDIRNIIPKNLAVGRYDGEVAISSGMGRASHCGEGENKIGCTTVDTICGYSHISADGVPVGSIKIDAEGMDEEVICGAVNTIYCCKPDISVALYHRAQDIVELPLLLRKHNHQYRFYLRKKEYVPAWDVFLYAIQGGNRK